MSSAQCLARLKEIDAEYSKGDFSVAMKKVLIEGIDTAASRAKTKEDYTNPSTTVHLLTDEILKSKR